MSDGLRTPHEGCLTGPRPLTSSERTFVRAEVHCRLVYALRFAAGLAMISGSCRWQATERSFATVRSAGSVSRQTGMAIGQRGWKWQPGGRSMAFGMSPASAGVIVLRLVLSRGAALTRACV